MDRKRIWRGMDHRLFFTILRDTLHHGPDRAVWGTTRRQKWLGGNSHRFPGALLISYFAYVEGALPPRWIDLYGEKQKRELTALRLTRNALTHFDGDLSRLRKNLPGRPKNPREYVRRFAADLSSGKVSQVQRQKVPHYLSVSRNGVVRLNDSAFHRCSWLFTDVLMRAGLVVEEANPPFR